MDALLPPQMAERAETIGVAKTSMDTPRLFVLAVLAGAFIALGAVFATTALAGSSALPWGPARVLGGVAFSLGLILVVVGGAELFTGNNLIVMAWASGRVSTPALLRNWTIVFVGNFAGAAATALAVCLAGTARGGDGAFGEAAFAVAQAKLALHPVQAVVLGMLGNALVCLAVWLGYSARTTADRILAIVPPISAFVAAGFEHSVANMYFVPYAIFVTALDPDWVRAHAPVVGAAAPTWSAFLVRNLAPVTLGNVIGGAVLVGAVYWFVYLRGRPASKRASGREP
ncbi:MAG TPA: formate/nitrite transporter family protein [Verrucomicrobiae bacterium]|jgi:formate transporter|nr:formate/nitrite transporter family protein [Verrucomicrobiae bacterium]